MATFSVIIPTKGRSSIHRTLESIVPQLEHGDEVIVVRDSTGDSGDTARNDGMSRARGTHLLFMDDDDVYVPGAFASMRRFAAENPGRIGIFKIEYVVGNRRWVDPELRFKNVSTQMYVVPNVPGKLGPWERRGRIAGDYVFIEETVRLQGAQARLGARPLPARAPDEAASPAPTAVYLALPRKPFAGCPLALAAG
jgi:glycosyltransferase involved in cell wall biosynthesis